VSGCDDRLVPITEGSITRDSVALEALDAQVRALAGGGEATGEQRALGELRTRIALELAPLRSGAWRRDPGAYRALAHDAILEVATRKHISPCERERRALKRLREVPEVLRAAEVNLGAQAAFDPDSETVRWTASMMDLRVTLPGLFNDCRDAGRFADLVEADTLALDAARRFVAVLRARSGPAAGR
jgi:hypothetical protein